MKLNGKSLVAVAVVVGAFSATGCKKLSNAADEAVAPEESVATAPVEESAAPAGAEQNSLRFRFYAPREPPAARYENPGRAPSERHFWANGYWRWNGREHVWVSGRWEPRRDRYEYAGPHWERHYGRWTYIPGRWVRR
ncbi:MAG: hypothetical protein QM820_25980 [Minicystis sp.]